MSFSHHIFVHYFQHSSLNLVCNFYYHSVFLVNSFISIIPSTLLSWNSSVRRCFSWSLIGLFSQLSIRISMTSWIFYSLCYNLLMPYFVVQGVTCLSQELSSVGSCVLWAYLLPVLSTFLLFSIIKYSKVILYFSCHSPIINHFSKDTYFLFLKVVFGNRDPDTRYVHFYLLIGLLFRQRQ